MLFKRKAKVDGEPEGGSPGQHAASEDVLRDELGLHRLWYLELRLRDEIARAARAEITFSLAAWRMRLLPGEAAHPELVARCATLIAGGLRSYDLLARLDGERFVAILFDADDRNAGTVAFRIKSDLQTKLPGAGRWQAGVATFGRDGVDADSLIGAVMRKLEEDARG
jgi:hypothetical protein